LQPPNASVEMAMQRSVRMTCDDCCSSQITVIPI
jgi:hypothetical protein